MNHSTRRIQKELAEVIKSDQTAANGFLVKLGGDNLNQWFVAFGKFPPETNIAKDLQKLQQTYGQDHLLLEIKFPATYPDDPPFVRVISPRIAFHSGHVTVGGSICIQTLVKTGAPGGWEPSVTMEGLLLIIRQLIIDGNGRIDFAVAMKAYSQEEARSAFDRVAKQHGWTQPKQAAKAELAPPVPYDFTVSFPAHWKMAQPKVIEQIELPGHDPADHGEGTAMYNEAAAVVKKFLASWSPSREGANSLFGGVGGNQHGRPVVTRVIRIQNKFLYATFHQKKTAMNYLNKGNDNEHWLFHGTKQQVVDSIIQTGFDARLSQPGMLGLAIYCTDNSALADKFAAGPERAIFYGRFLLGEVHQVDGNTASTTRIAPARTIYHEEEGRNINTHYDSLGSIYPMYNCPYWAIYSNDQTYPEYLLYYRLT